MATEEKNKLGGLRCLETSTIETNSVTDLCNTFSNFSLVNIKFFFFFLLLSVDCFI